MPNYVTNILEIYSEKKNNQEIIDFLDEHVKDNYFDFNTIIPEPKTEDECPKIYNLNIYNDNFNNVTTLHPPDSDNKWFNWYEWRIDHWNTKWNSCGTQYIDYEKILKEGVTISKPLIIVFDTAWHQPEPVILKLFQLHPELHIQWTYYSTENGKSGSYFKLFKEDEVVHSKYNLCCYGEDIFDVNTGKLNGESYDD